MSNYPWTIFFILFAAGLFGAIAVLPYAIAINPSALELLREKTASKKTPLSPAAIIVLASTAQSGILVAVSVFVGLLVSRTIGLGTPVLRDALSGQPVLDQILAFLPAAAIWALLGGGGILALERFVFAPRLPEKLREADRQVSFWKSVLACFYGGIVEELLLRLFVMAGLAWLIGLVWHTSAGLPTLGAFWTANLLSSVLFGLGHLPATVRIVPLTPLVVIRALVLNGLVGIGFGWLFMVYGLEAAIASHFLADILIHLIYPALPPAEGRNPKLELAKM